MNNKEEFKNPIMANKRGQLGMDIARSFVLGLVILVIISFIAVIIMGNLDSNSGLTAGSAAANASTDILNNGTQGLATFWSNAGTWFSLLSIVVLILIVAVVLVVVTRFGTGGRSSV